MTTITLLYHAGVLTGIQSRGHSGFAPKGSDIVCAAVSTLMQSLVLGLEDIAHLEGLEVEMNERIPIIRAVWPSAEQERIALLTDTVARSLEQIARENPKHIKLTRKEA